MITPDYVRLLARYNTWQNQQLRACLEALPADQLQADQGLFWGSVFGTANHLLWADMNWMHRFDCAPGHVLAMKDSARLCPTVAVWAAERFRTDGRITLWAKGLRSIDLAGRLRWHSPLAGGEVDKPLGELVVHMFNHQTHHRGQIHARLSAAGLVAPVTDLFLMPDTAA